MFVSFLNLTVYYVVFFFNILQFNSIFIWVSFIPFGAILMCSNDLIETDQPGSATLLSNIEFCCKVFKCLNIILNESFL